MLHRILLFSLFISSFAGASGIECKVSFFSDGSTNWEPEYERTFLYSNDVSYMVELDNFSGFEIEVTYSKNDLINPPNHSISVKIEKYASDGKNYMATVTGYNDYSHLQIIPTTTGFFDGYYNTFFCQAI